MFDTEIFFWQFLSPSSHVTSTLSECDLQPIANTGETPRNVCKVVADKNKKGIIFFINVNKPFFYHPRTN